MDFDAIPKHIYALIKRVEAIEAVLARYVSNGGKNELWAFVVKIVPNWENIEECFFSVAI